VSNEVTWVIRRINNEGVQTAIQDLPKRWTTVIKHNGDYVEGLWMYFAKINSFLKRKHTVCRTSEMTHVFEDGSCVVGMHQNLTSITHQSRRSGMQ
jgi:hypothetical protein